jgi:hypothetical protein
MSQHDVASFHDFDVRQLAGLVEQRLLRSVDAELRTTTGPCQPRHFVDCLVDMCRDTAGFPENWPS